MVSQGEPQGLNTEIISNKVIHRLPSICPTWFVPNIRDRTNRTPDLVYPAITAFRFSAAESHKTSTNKQKLLIRI